MSVTTLKITECFATNSFIDMNTWLATNVGKQNRTTMKKVNDWHMEVCSGKGWTLYKQSSMGIQGIDEVYVDFDEYEHALMFKIVFPFAVQVR